MADKVTSTKELKMDMKFVDGDNRCLSLDNPVSTIDKAAVKNLESVMKSSNILIGDKAGSAFYNIDTAKVVEKTTVQFDLR